MFKTGQSVHHMLVWNHPAQALAKRGKVHRCVQQPMLLVDNAGVEFGDRNRIPGQQQLGFGRVFATITDDKPSALPRRCAKRSACGNRAL